jgi:hypothetical protein
MEAEHSFDGYGEPSLPLADSDMSNRPSPTPISLCTMSKVLIAMVWIWALVETRWELAGETQFVPVIAIFVAKLIFTAIVLGTLNRVGAALVLFSFCCTVSIVVIAMALPRMYTIEPLYFRLELVETILKTAAVIALVFDYLNDDCADENPVESWQMNQGMRTEASRAARPRFQRSGTARTAANRGTRGM